MAVLVRMAFAKISFTFTVNIITDGSENRKHSNRLLKNLSFPGCSKRAGCKAPEIPRSEAYLAVRRNDEG